MSSKTKKSKKKIKNSDGINKQKDNAACKIFTYFTSEEMAEIKTILKVKDITGVPAVIAATVLYKFHILKMLVKDGHNINQTAQNNMTALIWAVKLKFLNFVEFLLANGADPTIKTDNGDNVLIMALENKLWDEEAFINLWKLVKKKSFIDVNFTNKNGHNMLHMCVRREWERVLQLLLAETPNVDDANFNGVTPLMLACFRTNHSIVSILIKAGANILKKDNHGRMPICYVISSSMKTKPPFLAMERVLSELNKKSSFEHYLKDTVDLIVSTAKKPEISTSTSEMLIKIIQFAVQYNNGIKLLLDNDIFAQLKKVLETQIDNLDSVKFILEICIEIFFYNDESQSFDLTLLQAIEASFFENNLVQFCVEVLYLNNIKTGKVAFQLLLLTLQDTNVWNKILEENCKILMEYANVSEDIIQEDNRIKIIEDQKEKLKKMLEKYSENEQTDRKSTENKIIKKSRRRSKGTKAKLSKMKTAELTKRLNLNGRKTNQQKVSKTDSSINENESLESIPFEQNPIVASLQHILKKPMIQLSSSKSTKTDDWKQQIWNTTVNFSDYCPINVKNIEDLMNSDIKIDAKLIDVIIEYLRDLIKFLVKKYKEHWAKDKLNGNCDCYGRLTNVLWSCNCKLDSMTEMERQSLETLESNFENLVKNLNSLSETNPRKCLEILNEIESTILHHEIRKIKMLTYITIREPFTLKYTNPNNELNENDLVKHIQNVLNHLENDRPEYGLELLDKIEDLEFLEKYTLELPMLMYYREMSMVPPAPEKNKRKEIESKLNTIANGFHLINSIMRICDDTDVEEDTVEERTEENTNKKIIKKRVYTISDLNHSMRGRIQPQPPPKQRSQVNYPEMLLKCVPKRLKLQILSLQMARAFQTLLDGNIRISVKEQRANYIISAGINFNTVELGLDIHNHPLAVKRVQRQSWVGRMIKTLVDPLMGLIDTHLLSYFACEYDDNELILATPMCKWNMAQYMQLLQHKNLGTLPGLTSIEIIKQFLDGLMVLHKCEIPIVHGNLKPSNIFIDFNGIVKIAEFGIHKALYKIVEPPKSALVWFAKETLTLYKSSSIVECSFKTDIQVAGMFIYFVLTYGRHPFGDDPEEILNNIQNGTINVKIKNFELREMLMWMLMSDSESRPTVEQVLSHPFFWLPAKKWNFILCCSGTNQTGFLLPLNICKLYRSIDTFADAYIQVDWQEMIQNKLPNAKLNDHKSITGLLRFIKQCYDTPLEAPISEPDLSSLILSLFPTLPVALYRSLNNTNWLKHAIFMQFSSIF